MMDSHAKKPTVIFDMDGVIVDNMDFHDKSWIELAQRRGKFLSQGELDKLVQGRTNDEANRNIFGKDISDQESKNITKEKQAIYLELVGNKIAPVEGLLDFLKTLKEKKITVGLATSATHNMVEFVFSKIDIEEYFQVVTCAQDVQKSKPAPDIYLETAKKLDVEPKDCIVFEDSFSGIESAQKAGMKVVALATTHKAHEIKDVDHIISDFREITIDEIEGLLY